MLQIGWSSELALEVVVLVVFRDDLGLSARALDVCPFSGSASSLLRAGGGFACWIFLFRELEAFVPCGLVMVLFLAGGLPGLRFSFVVVICIAVLFCGISTGPSRRAAGILSADGPSSS